MINVQHTYINICINVPCEKALDTHTHKQTHIYKQCNRDGNLATATSLHPCKKQLRTIKLTESGPVL